MHHPVPPRKARKDLATDPRDKDDMYQTPRDVTALLLRNVSLSKKILEPMAGDGHIVRRLQKEGHEVTASDIQRGKDFLKRKAVWTHDMVSNPPYKDDLPLRMAQHALEVVDGKVCMLMQGGFFWTEDRNIYFRDHGVPEFAVIVPWRIRFIKRDGSLIPGQFYSHAWVVWAERHRRSKIKHTRMILGDVERDPT